MNHAIFLLEIIGTIAFAISGVLAAKEKQMDLFGAIVLGCATAVGGGMMRDIILGKFPPVLFTDPIYTELSFITCILGFLIEKRHLHTTGEELTILLYMADSIGLGIFVVVGSQSAFHAGYGHNLFLCTFVGAITGIGGGLLRDMLSAELPLIMRKRVYGVAAILGSLSYSFLRQQGANDKGSLLVGVCFTILIRFLAIHFHWNLPSFQEKPSTTTDSSSLIESACQTKSSAPGKSSYQTKSSSQAGSISQAESSVKEKKSPCA